MGPLSTIFRSKLFVTGLVFLFIALVLSAVSVFCYRTVHYSSSGTLGTGQHVLGDEAFEGYEVTNRTLVLSSENASFSLLWGNYTSHNLSGRITLHPSGRPVINVYRGELNYTYEVTARRYPYVDLSIPALIFAITGTIFAWVGLERLLRR